MVYNDEYVTSRWNNLNKVKMEKEKTLEGASSIELFQNMCDELKDWIKEKEATLDANNIGSVQVGDVLWNTITCECFVFVSKLVCTTTDYSGMEGWEMMWMVNYLLCSGFRLVSICLVSQEENWSQMNVTKAQNFWSTWTDRTHWGWYRLIHI